MHALLSKLILACAIFFGVAQLSIAQSVFAVEPTMRATAFSTQPIKAGTKLKFTFKGLPENEVVMLQKCSEPCNSAKLVKSWCAKDCDSDNEQIVTIAESGFYYFWAQRELKDGSIGPDFFIKSKANAKGEYQLQSGAKIFVTISSD